MAICRKIYFFYIFSLITILIAIVIKPVSFKKSNCIVEGPAIPNITYSGKALDIKEFILPIPLISNPQNVFKIEPYALYEETIIKGQGKCSTLTKGIAYYLNRHDIDYQIIHLLPPKRFLEPFLSADGHTVLRTHYLLNGKTYIGIIDLVARGIPKSGDKFLDVADFKEGNITYFSTLVLNPRKDDMLSDYISYIYELSLDEVILGYTPSDEIKRYFDFINAIYKPLISEKLEKYVYDGLAVILGFYPKIYVESIPSLFGGYQFERYFFIFSAWVLRSAILLVPLIIIYEIRLFISNRLTRTNQKRRFLHSF